MVKNLPREKSFYLFLRIVIISPKLGFALLSSRASQTDPRDREQDMGTTARGGERLDDVHLSLIIEKIRAESKVGVTNKSQAYADP